MNKPNTHSVTTDGYMLLNHTILNRRYEILEPVGNGGFSIIYKAYDCVLDSVVALKEYFPHDIAERLPCSSEVNTDMRVITRNSRDKESFCRGIGQFREEAQTMVKLCGKHNTINVFDLFEENDTCYIVMEYLEGCTLMEFLHSLPGERMENIDDAKQIIYSVAEALKYVHSLGLLHRDVSPDNIFLCADGSVKLIDFGSAREISENGNMSVIVKAGCTPPEQYTKRGKQGSWTDIYAVGATLYRMLTGVYPETALDRIGYSESYDLPSMYNSQIPESIDILIQRCLAFDYTLRVSDISIIIQVLETGKQIPSVTVMQKRRSSLRIGTSVFVFIFVALAITISVILNTKSITLYNTVISPCTIRIVLPEKTIYSDSITALQADFLELYPQIELKFLPYDDGTADICPYNNSEEWMMLTEMQELHEFIAEDHVIFAYDAVLYYGYIEKAYDLSIKLPSENEFANLPENCISDNYEQFLSFNNNFFVYRGSVMHYRLIQNELNGMYRLWIPEKSLSPKCLAITKRITGNQKKAAMRVLLYLISERAQNILFITHDGIIPAEEHTFASFFNIHSELAMLVEEENKQ